MPIRKRTEYPERKSQRDEICEAIDAALARKPKDFRELIGILQEAGYEYKDGKQPALRGKGHARFARFRSLGKGYSVEELCEVIAGNAVPKQICRENPHKRTVSTGASEGGVVVPY